MRKKPYWNAVSIRKSLNLLVPKGYEDELIRKFLKSQNAKNVFTITFEHPSISLNSFASNSNLLFTTARGHLTDFKIKGQFYSVPIICDLASKDVVSLLELYLLVFKSSLEIFKHSGCRVLGRVREVDEGVDASGN